MISWWPVCAPAWPAFASTEEGFYPVLEAKAEHSPDKCYPGAQRVSWQLFVLSADDDGTVLARRIKSFRDPALWVDLSQSGLTLARAECERQVDAISAQIRALALLR